MTLTQSVIDAAEWHKVTVLRGTGSELAASLKRFLAAATPEEASELWWGLEGVAFILNGESDDDSSLVERCREGALRGAWLLAEEASQAADAGYMDAVLEVLTHIDPAMAQMVLASHGRELGKASGGVG